MDVNQACVLSNKQQAKLEAANRKLEKALTDKGLTVEPPTVVEGDKEKEEQLEDQRTLLALYKKLGKN